MPQQTQQLIGFIHSIESFGTLDGPGLRTVVFFQGCPLHCLFCHNVDCMIQKGANAYLAEDLVTEILKNSSYWEEHGNTCDKVIKGGVTISGGEPMGQPEFLLAVLKKLKERGVHTAVDTSLYTSKQVIDSLLPFVDLWMVSVKHMNDEQHIKLTSVSSLPIQSNIRYLDEQIGERKLKSTIRIRFVVIPGITDEEHHVEELGQFVSEIKHLDKLELLPYGTHGKHKWLENFGVYPLEMIRAATEKDIERVKGVLGRFGFPVLL